MNKVSNLKSKKAYSPGPTSEYQLRRYESTKVSTRQGQVTRAVPKITKTKFDKKRSVQMSEDAELEMIIEGAYDRAN